MTIHVFPCNPDKGGCGFEIPLTLAPGMKTLPTGEFTITCPRCGKVFKRIFLGVDVKGFEAG